MTIYGLEEHMATTEVVEAWKRADPGLTEPMMRWAVEGDFIQALLDLDDIPRIRRSLGSTVSEAPPRWCHVTQEGPDHRVSLLSCPGYWLRGAPHPRARAPKPGAA